MRKGVYTYSLSVKGVFSVVRYCPRLGRSQNNKPTRVEVEGLLFLGMRVLHNVKIDYFLLFIYFIFLWYPMGTHRIYPLDTHRVSQEKINKKWWEAFWKNEMLTRVITIPTIISPVNQWNLIFISSSQKILLIWG